MPEIPRSPADSPFPVQGGGNAFAAVSGIHLILIHGNSVILGSGENR